MAHKLDEQVLRRAMQGDERALVTLLREYGAAARRAIAGNVPRRWQAVLSEDDIMQQTYADAVANIHQFESNGDAAFAQWLASIAKRNLLDVIKMLEADKRGGDRRKVELDGGDDPRGALCDLLAARGTSPSGGAARNEARAALERAIAELPEAYARAVTMYDLEGRPIEQVAEALQRSPGAVFMLRARAHERLHRILGQTSRYFTT